jgi:hypothetical protein
MTSLEYPDFQRMSVSIYKISISSVSHLYIAEYRGDQLLPTYSYLDDDGTLHKRPSGYGDSRR